MPLSLEETNLLIAVLGVEVPPVILEQKALEEKFNKREAEVAARSGEMKQRSDGAKLQALFTQAGTTAKGKDFAGALKLLDQVEAGLAMPDPADEYRKRAAEMKQRGDGAKLQGLFDQAAAAAAGNDFAAAQPLLDQVETGLAEPDVQPPGSPKPSAADEALGTDPRPTGRPAPKIAYAQTRLAWDDSRRRAHADVAKLEQAILAMFKADPNFADLQTKVRKLDTILGNFGESLGDMLDQAYNAADADKPKFHQQAVAIIGKYRAYVDGDAFVGAVAANPVVAMNFKADLSSTLSQMAQQLGE